MSYDPPLPLSHSKISQPLCSILLRLFIVDPPYLILPLIAYFDLSPCQNKSQTTPPKLLLLSSSEMFYQDRGESTLTFRLLHFWESRKTVKGGPQILLGLELLMIDEEGTMAQGFIGQNRHYQYEKELERGRIYALTNYYASNSKVIYHLADQRLVICISHASVLSKVEENNEGILMERFRIHSFLEFEANCDLKGDLHDVVGHLKLVDGQPLQQRPVLCAKDDSVSRNILVHLQLREGQVMNLYLWDEAAENFRLKFDASASTPTVLLVTTVTPKRLGGKLCLSSMSSSRVFFYEEVHPTKEYLSWLTTNPSANTSVNPIEVVKS